MSCQLAAVSNSQMDCGSTTTTFGLLRPASKSSAAVPDAAGASAGVSLAFVPASACSCAPSLLLAAGASAASGASSGSSSPKLCLLLQSGHSKLALGTCIHQPMMQSEWNSCPHCSLRHASASSMFRRQTTHWLPSSECDTGKCFSTVAFPIVTGGGDAPPVPSARARCLSARLRFTWQR
eukprot:CAMPEP_0172669640 /NCGR_PEP_ID=MMETSP1074-20121228/9810_1 /TAXON_ID=2916 /ORGANISM="Ceratium fusus, Strain PA161109" /LENGTH=179 /DNA_ID=CAMNT_0013486445 /DNA_START=13 /DNA_END=553 /DNA_ORIENTATION=+